jgi:hypothetical protein
MMDDYKKLFSDKELGKRVEDCLKQLLHGNVVPDDFEKDTIPQYFSLPKEQELAIDVMNLGIKLNDYQTRIQNHFIKCFPVPFRPRSSELEQISTELRNLIIPDELFYKGKGRDLDYCDALYRERRVLLPSEYKQLLYKL